MKRASRAFLIAGLICVCALVYAGRYSYVRGPQLASLESDNLVVVDYWTGGCGHNQHYLITFRDGISENATIELIRDARKSPDDKNPFIIKVQPEELHGLDDYVHSHRVRWFSNGLSTERRKFSIAWFKHGRMWLGESYVDRNPYEYYRGRRAFTFEDLARPIHPMHIKRFEKPTNQALNVSSIGPSDFPKDQSTEPR